MDIAPLITLTAVFLVVVIALLYFGQKTRVDARAAAENTRRVQEELTASTAKMLSTLTVIHALVNSRLSEALKKIDALESMLHDATGYEPTGEPVVEPPPSISTEPEVPTDATAVEIQLEPEP